MNFFLQEERNRELGITKTLLPRQKPIATLKVFPRETFHSNVFVVN